MQPKPLEGLDGLACPNLRHEGPADRKVRRAFSIPWPGEATRRYFAAVKLSTLLPASQIRVPLTARTKTEAIDELLAAVPFESDTQRRAARDAAIAREAEISTGIGRGVAIPHGRTAAVSGHHCAFGVAASPIDWDAIDGTPCRILFLCVSPEHDAAGHIRVLSQVARVLNNSKTRQAIETARTADDIRRVFLDDEEREGL